MKKFLTLFLMAMFSVGMFAAQGGTLTADPAAPIDPSATVTLTYDGAGTNFDKWQPECFIHTWLVPRSGETFAKEYGTEWVSCSGSLEGVDDNRKMTYAGTAGVYTISMNIKSFFGVEDADLEKIAQIGVIVCTQYNANGDGDKTNDMFLTVAVPGQEPEEPITPIEPKEGYALLVNGADTIALAHGEEYEGYDQWYTESASLKENDVVKVYNYATDVAWAIGILNPASSKHVANSAEGLVFDSTAVYTIYLKLKFELDEIYVAPLANEGEEPVDPIEPGKEGFALLVNGADTIALAHGEEYEGYDQWYTESASLKANDVVKVYNYATDVAWAIGILNPASSKHVANSAEGLVFDSTAVYTIYLKLKFELDEIYVAPLANEGEEPVDPIEPGKEGYALLVNGADTIALAHGEEYEGYDQWFTESASLKANDVVKVYNYATDAAWAVGILNPASSKHVANSAEGLVFDSTAVYTIYLKLKFELDEIYVAPLANEGEEPVDPIEPAETEYYLVGSIIGWEAKEEFKLKANEGADGEYMIEYTAQANEGLKVLGVAGEEKIWYKDGEGTEYIVAEAGDYTIYFRPEGNAEWAYTYFELVKKEPVDPQEGIDNTNAAVKAVKMVRNGQLLIEKNGVLYNAQGVIVK